MKIKDLRQLLNNLPDAYDNSTVYMTFAVDYTRGDEVINGATLLNDVTEVAVDFEDSVIIFRGELD